MMNKDWIRWIVASSRQYFYERRQDIAFFAEGEDRDNTASLDKYFEWRFNGPYIKTYLKDEFKLSCQINCVCTVKQNDNTIDDINVVTGIVSSIYGNIPIFRKPEDPTAYLGCLVLIGELKIMQLGQIDIKTRVIQSMIEGSYELEL